MIHSARHLLKDTRTFRRDEDGSLIIFSLFIFVLMLIIAGISLDIERFETARTKLQATADGASLAAASLTQEVSAEALVQDYFAKAGMSQFVDNVTVQESINFKRVTVDADVNVPTHFFNMIGIENLGTLVDSTAEESIGDVEISLVLDVSGSMGSNYKLTNLKSAAADFLDSIYGNSEEGSVSTSIIPYSTQVSAGPDILDYYTNRGVTSHEFSHCVNFKAADYDVTALPLDAAIEQTLHFDPWTTSSNWQAQYGLYHPLCPQASWARILPYGDDLTALKSYVNALNDTDNTSIEIGVKWGAIMLDPAFRPVVSGLIADGKVANDFSDRPMDYDNSDGLKVMVVMTDGQNTSQYYMSDPYRSGDSIVFVWYDANDRPYFSIWGAEGEPIPEEQFEEVETTECVRYDYYYDRRGRRQYYCVEYQTTVETVAADNWYLANRYSYDSATIGWRTTPYGGQDAQILSWDEVWRLIPVDYFVDQYLRNMGGMDTRRSAIKNSLDYVSGSTKDTRLLNICNAVKAEDVYVYTIGFEAPSTSETLLQNCATTASHYFDVEGTQISQAFSAIAADINRLRLVVLD